MGLLKLDKSKTYRPKKTHARGTKRYELHLFSKASLGAGDIVTAVKLPPGEDQNEWLAVHVVDFFNSTNLVFGAVSERCTVASCPTMNASDRFEYLWQDDKSKKPIAVAAPKYIDLLMEWIEQQLSNESVFPSSTSVPFPKNFKSVVSTIFKRLFRVYAHLFYIHMDTLIANAAEAHINTAFKHFILFSFEFDLIDSKELAPLKDKILLMLGDRYRDKLPK